MTCWRTAWLRSGLIPAWLLVSSNLALAGDQRPNIILFVADDQGWNGTSVQMDPDVAGSQSDYYLTPNLEELADRGMRFSRGYSAAPLCQPTRASIQTGMSPAQLQYTNNVRGTGNTGFPLSSPRTVWFDDDNLTIARWLEQHQPEYASAHVGKWHLVGTTPDEMGYDFAADLGNSPDDPWGIAGLTEMAVGFMQERVQGAEPFFLQLSHRAVHTPIRARPETIEMFENIEPGSIHRNPEFAAMTYDLDTSLGGILDAVRDLGIEDNTYIIYVSDNGSWRTQSSTSPLGGGKNFIHEGGIRVPTVVAGPGVEAGSVSSVPVVTTDLLSTVSDLAGIDAPLPDKVEGTSFAPVLFNGGSVPPGSDNLVRDFGPNGELFFHSPHNFGATSVHRIAPMSAVVRGDWKLFKIWGENGEPDQIYLTNLAEGYYEPVFLTGNSGGSKANQFPDIAAELEATLMQWLEGVDASLPYDVKENVELHWHSGQPGLDPQGWRSTVDVDYVLRETWTLGEDQAKPQLVDTEPYQPELVKHAFHFDGDDVMGRKFFHVSDLRERHNTPNAGTPDFDRSATFEFWIRPESLDREQVLFESGEPNQGLSITLGDGDADGVHDEVRMRALGDDGQFLSVTAELDRFSNPTRDFVHLVAVLNDAPDDRFAELYVNGASLSRVNGQSGSEGSIRWDSFGSYFNTGNLTASLGGQYVTGLGGAFGAGELPFEGGPFRGDIAAMRFFNYALPAEEIGSHYNEVLDVPGLGVAALTGDVVTPRQRPHDVSEGALESSDSILAIQERTDILDAPLLLDFAAPDLGGQTLPAGTEFTSYLIHFDPVGDPAVAQAAAGEIRFAAPVLGVLYEPESLSQTDAILGSIGRYDTGSHTREGFFSLDPDGHSLTVLLNGLLDEVMQLRVLTVPARLLEGDYNGDLRVDQADLDLVLLNWGEDGTIPPDGWRANPPAGVIGQAQLDGVLLHWGDRASGLVGASAAVPEPGSLVLLAGAALSLLLHLYLVLGRRAAAQVAVRAVNERAG